MPFFRNHSKRGVNINLQRTILFLENIQQESHDLKEIPAAQPSEKIKAMRKIAAYRVLTGNDY